MAKRKRKKSVEGFVKLTVTISPSTDELLRKVSTEMNASMSSIVEYCLQDTLQSSSDVMARQMVLAYRRVIRSIEVSPSFEGLPNEA